MYNTNGDRQTISVSIDNGEGVRFWIALDNDGSSADTLVVQGCQGNRYFIVNKVVLGKYKRPDAGATKVTNKFKDQNRCRYYPASQVRSAPEYLQGDLFHSYIT